MIESNDSELVLVFKSVAAAALPASSVFVLSYYSTSVSISFNPSDSFDTFYSMFCTDFSDLNLASI